MDSFWKLAFLALLTLQSLDKDYKAVSFTGKQEEIVILCTLVSPANKYYTSIFS